MFSNVFEVTAAIVISLLARLLSVKSVFCYEAVASASLCLVLPGYIIREYCPFLTRIESSDSFARMNHSVRLPGIGIQEHDLRISPAGVCYHLLALHWFRHRYWLGSVLCLRPSGEKVDSCAS